MEFHNFRSVLVDYCYFNSFMALTFIRMDIEMSRVHISLPY